MEPRRCDHAVISGRNKSADSININYRLLIGAVSGVLRQLRPER